MYQIFVHNYEIDIAVGAYDYEMGRTQRVAFDVDITLAAPPADTDNLDDIVSYDSITQTIRDITQAGHIKLLETVAVRLRDAIMADARITALSIRIQKREVLPPPASVGVCVTAAR